MIVVRILAGAFLGLFAGSLGVVVHGGPVDRPVIGLLLAFILVATGAWMSVERWAFAGWLSYMVSVIGMTLALFMTPYSDDAVTAPSSWVSVTWMFMSVLAIFVPFIRAGIVRSRAQRRATLGGEEPNV